MLTLTLVLSFPKIFENRYLYSFLHQHNSFFMTYGRGESGLKVGLGTQFALCDFLFCASLILVYSKLSLSEWFWKFFQTGSSAARIKKLELKTKCNLWPYHLQEPAPGSSGTYCCSIYLTDVSREWNKTVGLKYTWPVATGRQQGICECCQWVCIVCVCVCVQCVMHGACGGCCMDKVYTYSQDTPVWVPCGCPHMCGLHTALHHPLV